MLTWRNSRKRISYSSRKRSNSGGVAVEIGKEQQTRGSRRRRNNSSSRRVEKKNRYRPRVASVAAAAEQRQ